ncbi:hypothetical protein [Mycobacterium sp. 155]|uniref:hypothetical protein n=1 Tax=Mycobacterium sp. 155 TaxID=1157943 RepID=UPI0003824B91|nr:hypothetical protein [Mycobacterium sp. 155]
MVTVTAITTAECAGLTRPQIEAVAWGFLRSEFTQRMYASWPIDRRIDAYLHHHGLQDIINDGSAYDRLTERVMANLGRARRTGQLGLPNQLGLPKQRS